MTLTSHGDPATVTVSVVGTDFLRVLEVKPSLGSDFQPQGQPERALLLSHKLWESYFGGDSKAVGQIIALIGLTYTIAGVMLVVGVRKLLLVFMGAVGFVFLISCANFANLLLIRGSGRQPEVAVCAALAQAAGD